MLFKPELARLILKGDKTQHRKPVTGRGSYRAGRSYPLERRARRDEMSEVDKVRMDRTDPKRRGRPPLVEIGRITVTAARVERLGNLTFEDARAEGFRTPADFARYWLATYDRAWPAIEQVPCPSCLADPNIPADELPPCATCDGDGDIDFLPYPTDDEVLERFHAHHAERTVWVLTFALDRTHEGRYLAENCSSGYVNREYDARGRRVAVRGEPEALSESDHAKHVATPDQQAKEKQRQADVQEHHRRDRELLTVERRLIEANAAARRNGIDISGEFSLWRRHQQNSDGAGQIRALKSMERLAYREAA